MVRFRWESNVVKTIEKAQLVFQEGDLVMASTRPSRPKQAQCKKIAGCPVGLYDYFIRGFEKYSLLVKF